MERSTIIAGFGGQGILFAGKVLAQAGPLGGREVPRIPPLRPQIRRGRPTRTPGSHHPARPGRARLPGHAVPRSPRAPGGPGTRRTACPRGRSRRQSLPQPAAGAVPWLAKPGDAFNFDRRPGEVFRRR